MKGSWTLGLVVSVVAVLLTWGLNDFRLFQLATVASWAVAMLGLNLLTGYNGQISLGHGAFMGVGMYSLAILNRDVSWMSYPLALFLAFVIAFVLGIFIGIPALRLPGTSLALITLALAMAFPQVLRKYDTVTGGVQGISPPLDTQFSVPSDDSWFSDDQWRYIVIVGLSIVVFWLVWNLVRGRWGLAMMAVRDNPVSAASMGVNLPATKVITFAISAGLAGLGGAMQMMVVNYVSPDSVTLVVSISLLTGIVIGGLGTVAGAVIGGAFIVFMPNIALKFSDAAPGVVYGVIIILVMLFAPGGVMGLARRIRIKLRPASGRETEAEKEMVAFPTDIDDPVPTASSI